AEAGEDEKPDQCEPSSPEAVTESAKDVQKEENMVERKRASPCADQDDAKRRRVNGSGDSPKVRESVSGGDQLSSDKFEGALQSAESPAISPVLPRRHEVTEGFDDEFPGTEDVNVDKAALSSAQQTCFKVRRPQMSSDCEVLTTDDFGLTVKRLMLLLLLTYALGVLGAGSMFCNGIFSLLVAIGSLVLVIQQKRARRVRALRLFAQVERDSSISGEVGGIERGARLSLHSLRFDEHRAMQSSAKDALSLPDDVADSLRAADFALPSYGRLSNNSATADMPILKKMLLSVGCEDITDDTLRRLVPLVEGENDEAAEDVFVRFVADNLSSSREALTESWQALTRGEGETKKSLLRAADVHRCMVSMGLPITMAACKDLIRSY
ncbi:hypothetical protein FOZ63_004906, partial [Perkinsus olseni]